MIALKNADVTAEAKAVGRSLADFAAGRRAAHLQHHTYTPSSGLAVRTLLIGAGFKSLR